MLKDRSLNHDTLVTGTDPREAAVLVTRYLRENPAVKVVLATGQADTEGAGLAVEESFRDGDFFVAGFDLSPELIRLIQNGTISCTIDQQPYVQGFYPVVQLAHWCRYGLKPASIDAGVTVIDRTNVNVVSDLCQMGYR